MIVSGWLMLPDPPGSVRLELGYVEISRGVITAIESGDPIFMADFGGPEMIVCPGFVDAHVHLPQFAAIGVDGLPLLEWLHRAIFPAEARWADPDVAYADAHRAIEQIISFGTTAFAGYATVHHEATRRAIQAAHQLGVRAMIGQVLMDREAPSELIRPTAQLLEEAASLRGLGRVEHAITPRFAITCSQLLLEGAGRIAARLSAPVQTHLAETRDECERVAELFERPGYARVYDDAGLLGDRSILAHGIWLEDDDRALLAERGSVVAHCPTANVFLGSGSMDRPALQRVGVPTALGSDVAGGPDRSMVRVARSMLETARWRGDEPPAARQCWWQITGGNAQALGFADAGRLEVGRPADLALIEPDIDLGLGAEQPAGDPLAALLYGWDDRWLRRTLVAGETRYSAPGL